MARFLAGLRSSGCKRRLRKEKRPDQPWSAKDPNLLEILNCLRRRHPQISPEFPRCKHLLASKTRGLNLLRASSE